MSSNVIEFPTIGKAITLADQGVYFTMNTVTGKVHSIFRLDFDREWYLHQLQNVGTAGDFAWVIMASNANDITQSMRWQDVRLHFNKPEFAIPKGAWQVVRNSLFGFGKFTPSDKTQPINYALIPFVNDEMRMPVRIVKANAETLYQAEQVLGFNLAIA